MKIHAAGIPGDLEINSTNYSTCKSPSCKAKIYFTKSPNTGKTVVVSQNPDNSWSNHFLTCTTPNSF